MKTQNCDRRFWLETAVFLALLYGVAACVYLNGDDFMYGAFAHTGLIANVTDYYFTGNGRYWINILDSVLLWFDRYAFILVLPWIVLAFVVLLAKVIQRLMAGQSDWQKEKELIRMGMVLFACLDVLSLTAAFGAEKNSRRMLAVNVVVLVGCLISPILDKAIFDVALIGLLTVQIVMLLIRERFAPGVWFLIFVGLGSQGMLLISAIWGFRCMFSMYMVYMLLIGCCLYHMDAQRRSCVLAAGLLMSFHPGLALAFCVVLMAKPECLKRAVPVGLRCAVVLAMAILIAGYAKNTPVHRQNLRNTAQITDSTIVIAELPDDLYSWYFVPIGEFHEDYYRMLHEIPDSVEIVYEKLPE